MWLYDVTKYEIRVLVYVSALLKELCLDAARDVTLDVDGVLSFNEVAISVADSATDLLQFTSDFHELLSSMSSATFWTLST